MSTSALSGQNARRGMAEWLGTLVSVSMTVMLSLAGDAWAAPRFTSVPPPDFKGSQTTGIEHHLMFRGRSFGSVLWVETLTAGRFALSTGSVSALITVLRDSGIERNAARQFAEAPYHGLSDVHCLSLAAAPDSCVEFTLKLVPSAEQEASAERYLELALDEAALPKLIEPQIVNELSLVGYSGFYAGWSAGATGGHSTSLGTGQRGVLSRGASRFEYDFAANSSASYSPDGDKSTNTLFFNTLALGRRQSSGTGYAGLFRAGAGGNAFGVGQAPFLNRPAQLGVAWQSSNANLAAIARRQRVRLQLLTPGFVRILSAGAQVFESQLQAGDQWVEFGGYAEPFVDVVIRNQVGQETRQRVQTVPVENVQSQALGTDRHLWYFDMGKPLRLNGADNRNMETVDTAQGYGAYSYLFDSFALSAAGQFIGSQKRLAASVAGLNGRWNGNAMLGGGGELGWGGSVSPNLGDLSLGLSYTGYQPPTEDGKLSSRCTVDSLNVCFSQNPGGYRSWSFSAGYRGFPVSVGASRYEYDSAASQLYYATLSLPVFNTGAFLSAFAMFNPSADAKSLSLNLTIPLSSGSGGFASAGGGFSTDFRGNRSTSASYGTAFPSEEESVMRSLQIGLASYLPHDAEASHVVSGYASGQIGPATTNLALLGGSDGSKGVNASVGMYFGISPYGASLGAGGNNVPVSDLFGGADYAGVSVINRSQERQEVMLEDRQVSVPPNSNMLIPVRQGVVKGVQVVPGPVANEDEVRAPRTLYKGNLKTITIEEGFWIIAKFKRDESDGASGLIQPRYTYKRPGEKMERLHADSKGGALLFEFKENGQTIERFVTGERQDEQYRCLMDAKDRPTLDDAAVYKEVIYSCNRLQGPGDTRQPATMVAVAPAQTPAVAEEVRVAESPLLPEVESRSKLPPLSVNTVVPDSPELAVRRVVERWAALWSARDLKGYLAIYAEDFMPERGMESSCWTCQRRDRILGRSKIRVEADQMQVHLAADNRARVRFRQTYRSPVYSDISVKTLDLVKVGGEWRIVREVAVPVARTEERCDPAQPVGRGWQRQSAWRALRG